MAKGETYTKWGTKIVQGKVIGRDNIVVPPEEVEDLAQIGCNNNEIAKWFGVDENTLTYNFSVELTKGRENLKQKLRRAQLKAALTGNVVMLIWLGKNLLGQSDSGMKTDASTVLPFTDEDELTVTEEFKDELKQEYNQLEQQ